MWFLNLLKGALFAIVGLFQNKDGKLDSDLIWKHIWQAAALGCVALHATGYKLVGLETAGFCLAASAKDQLAYGWKRGQDVVRSRVAKGS